MTKIDIFSGFLGAGKTTLIKKMISEVYHGEKLVLIENEFGEIGIDGGFLAEAGIQINEMNSGCICCSLKGNFEKALNMVIHDYAPDRVLIEPSGVGKLSDVIRAVQAVQNDAVVLNMFTTVVDANKCKMYMKNFGEFFNDQVENAGCIVMSHTENMSEKKLSECVELLRKHNATAVIISTPVSELTAEQLLSAMERKDTLAEELARLAEETEEEHHHHHHDDDDDDDDDCCCGHDHDHEHHHHDDDDDDDDDCCCGHDHDHEHHHHHDDDDDCCCGHDHDHEHHHHHHHHADEVFVSYGAETAKRFDREALASALEDLCDEGKYGVILRAKGIVPATDGTWIHFDYVPGEPDVRTGPAAPIGRLCVIGSGVNKDAVGALLGVVLE